MLPPGEAKRPAALLVRDEQRPVGNQTELVNRNGAANAAHRHRVRIAGKKLAYGHFTIVDRAVTVGAGFPVKLRLVALGIDGTLRNGICHRHRGEKPVCNGRL